MSVHSEAAQARVEQLRAMREQIPNFVIPETPGEARSLARAAGVPPEFVERVGVAVKNSVALVRGGSTDPERARDLMSFAEAYEPLADELEALASFVRHSVRAARNQAGSEALTTYALARRLAKRREHAELRPHVADMSRILGARPRKTKAKETPVPTTPTTSPATPSPTPTSPAPTPTSPVTTTPKSS